MKATITITKDPLYNGYNKTTKRQTLGWTLRYDDKDGGFWCHSFRGGLLAARRYAKILKAKLKTDPTIKELKGK